MYDSMDIYYSIHIFKMTDSYLFCKKDLEKRRYSAKETYNFIDPTDLSHPIAHSYMCDRLIHICVTGHIHICDMTPSCVLHRNIYVHMCIYIYI